MGWNSQPTRVVSLDEVRVHRSQMLGEPGAGFRIAMRGLDGGRINIGKSQTSIIFSQLQFGCRQCQSQVGLATCQGS